MSRIASTVLLLAFCAAAHAQLYRWTDEKGRVHVTDTPPPASAKSVQTRSSSAPATDGGQMPYELVQATRDFPVVLYTSPSCKEACASARAHLNQRSVPFKEVQVWDAKSNEELRNVSGGNEVPTLLVGRSVQRGFEASYFDALLDSARYPRAGLLPPRNQGEPPPPQNYPASAAAPKPAAEEPPRPLGPYAPGAPRQGSSQRPSDKK